MPVADLDELRKQVAETWWYHTLELAPGLETPGWFDTRPVLDRIPFPADLSGRRCLDIGTFDGFWAFTMERRGAGEVMAIDVPDPRVWDWPANSPPEAIEQISSRRPGSGFALAAAVFDSKVERRELSVYDLDPAQVGTFDFVYVGSLLLHLRDPVGALMKVRKVCSGSLLLVDAVSLSLGLAARPAATLDGMGRPWWWKPNVEALVRMVEAAGFSPTGKPVRLFMPPGKAQEKPDLSVGALRLLRNRAGRDALVSAWKGDPHAAVAATVR
ncbi:MAG TPA: hypothetical protein VFA11_07685 [Acidimicrobiales bacterium]|nr:hypothetical protein [Acidimicrobiales bacterium]